MGKYSVCLEDFEEFYQEVFASFHHQAAPGSVLIIDEIGKMELFSRRFTTDIKSCINTSSGKGLHVVCTIAQKGGSTIQEIKNGQAVDRVYTVTHGNRDALLNEITAQIESRPTN